jgi:putative NADPH-quinone reductase
MPKIVALACSPSKGFNSDTMLDAFLSGMSEIKQVKVEKIYLNDLQIENYSFLNRLPDAVKEPQFVALIDKIVKADGVVIATPCFNFSVPAALKNLLDRMSYKALNPKSLNWLSQPKGLLTNLHNFYLVSCGTPAWMVRVFLWPIFPVNWLRVVFGYFGSKTWGGIYGAGLNTNNLAKNNPKLMERCRKAGRGYAQRLVKLLV